MKQMIPHDRKERGYKLQLFQGDCLTIMETLPPIDLIFTSPPYFNAREYSQFESYDTYLEFLSAFFRKATTCLKENRILAINLSCVLEPREKRSTESIRYPIPFDAVKLARDAGFKFLDDIIWEKPDGASNRAIKFSHHRRPVAYKPFTITEYILIFKRDDGGLLDGVIRSHTQSQIENSLVLDGYERTNIWKISPERVKGHPAPFPIKLAHKIIEYYSYTGDTVCDPFMGSGTTGIACRDLKRGFIGIEKSSEYIKIAKDRISSQL